jgi:transposase-like protein
VLVQTKRNKRAALKLMRKLLKKYGFHFVFFTSGSRPRLSYRNCIRWRF